MRTISEINQVIQRNGMYGRPTFYGLTTEEISRRNRVCMFGDDDEAFPDRDEWSAWVD